MRLRIRITPGAILLVAVLAFEKRELFIATVIAAAFHECGHLFAARRLGIRLRLLEIDVMGAKLYPATALPSYRAEAILAAAGPLFSLLLAAPFFHTVLPFFVFLRNATLSFALLNLFPIEGFDGGRMLSALICAVFGERAATRALFVTTYLSLLLLFSISACLLLRYGEDASLTVFCASLFARLFLFLDTPARVRGGAKHKKRGFERI